jgi:hypothetical protein
MIRVVDPVEWVGNSFAKNKQVLKFFSHWRLKNEFSKKLSKRMVRWRFASDVEQVVSYRINTVLF